VTVPRVMEPLLSPQDASAGVTTMAVGPPVFWILAWWRTRIRWHLSL